MRALVSILASLVCLSGWAIALDAPGAEELARRNRQLEQRVRQLERTALAEDIERYLEDSVADGSAEGGTSLVPGGLAIRFSGHNRIREDVSHHAYAPKDAAGERSFEFTHMRTRFRADVDVGEDLSFVVEFQDVRTWGAEGSTTGLLNAVDLKRGYARIGRVLGGPVTVEAGRLFLFYGDHRVIGHLEWVDQGRSYDGVRVQVRPEGWWVDLMAVRVRDTAPVNDDDKVFFAAYGGWKWLEAYALWLSDHKAAPGETRSGDTEFLTAGLRLHRRTDDEAWDYTVEVLFQGGNVRGDDLAAFGAAVNGGYTFRDNPWKPRIGFEVALATGDDNPADGDQGALQTLFPTNHPLYGYADLVGWSNMLDLHARVTVTPLERAVITLGYHHFRRLEEQGAWVNAGGATIRAGAAGSDRHLADEIDLMIVWKARAGLSFLIQYAIFLPGGFVEDTGDSPVAHVAYIQSVVKF